MNHVLLAVSVVTGALCAGIGLGYWTGKRDGYWQGWSQAERDLRPVVEFWQSLSKGWATQAMHWKARYQQDYRWVPVLDDRSRHTPKKDPN